MSELPKKSKMDYLKIVKCGDDCMSEKRFSDLNDLQAIIEELEQKIDEQQATIKQLESDKAIAEDYANIFEKENVKLRKQIDEQQAIINELKAQLREKEQDERLYADEIVKLNKEAKEVLDFKSLGGDY